MIYCIGLREKYERALAAGQPVSKQGKGTGSDGKPYPGGSVWRTADEAQRFIARNGLYDRAVYAVIADWESDTEQKPGEDFRRLLRSAEVRRL